MRYLKYFESNSEIDSICQKYDISNYTINSDGSIDVDGDVLLFRRNLKELPLKFNRVHGHFNCTENELTNLDGCPKYVGGIFGYSRNNIDSLRGCPDYIGGPFYFAFNKLSSIEGYPKEFKGELITLRYNSITNFNGFPENYDGRIDIKNNPIEEIYNLFGSIECINLLNEFDVINDKTIIMDRLEEVYSQLGMKMPIRLKFINYEIS